jgi:hypothetical protein
VIIIFMCYCLSMSLVVFDTQMIIITYRVIVGINQPVVQSYSIF